MRRKISLAVVVLLIFSAGVAEPVLAGGNESSGNETDSDDDDDPVINIDVSGIIDAVEDLIDEVTGFTDGFKQTLIQVGLTIFVKPAQWIVNQLSDILTIIMVAYPDVRQQEVVDLHSFVFKLTLLLAAPAFVWLGFEHMTGRRSGVRPVVELTILLVLGGLAPWLLYYPIELSRLVAVALQPENVPIVGFVRMSAAAALIFWVEAIILIMLVIIFATKNFFLMYYVVASPLIFLLSYFRPTQGHMQKLTGLFIGFLLISPMDLIAYRLVLILMDTEVTIFLGNPPISEMPDFIWGFAGLFVLLGIPWEILRSGSALAAPAMVVSRKASNKAGERVKPVVSDKYRDLRENVSSVREFGGRARNRFLEERPVNARVEHRSGNEVELHRTDSRVRSRSDRLKQRFRDDTAEVEVEDNWRQDDGEWSKEAELKEGDSE